MNFGMNLVFFWVITLAVLYSNVKAEFDPNFAHNRTTMVHLFEWKWNDIGLECERFLSPAGFGGVQVIEIDDA
jgi:alpha-amylase